jgi:hypothetical protein
LKNPITRAYAEENDAIIIAADSVASLGYTLVSKGLVGMVSSDIMLEVLVNVNRVGETTYSLIYPASLGRKLLTGRALVRRAFQSRLSRPP